MFLFEKSNCVKLSEELKTFTHLMHIECGSSCGQTGSGSNAHQSISHYVFSNWIQFAFITRD